MVKYLVFRQVFLHILPYNKCRRFSDHIQIFQWNRLAGYFAPDIDTGSFLLLWRQVNVLMQQK